MGVSFLFFQGASSSNSTSSSIGNCSTTSSIGNSSTTSSIGNSSTCSSILLVVVLLAFVEFTPTSALLIPLYLQPFLGVRAISTSSNSSSSSSSYIRVIIIDGSTSIHDYYKGSKFTLYTLLLLLHFTVVVSSGYNL